MSTEMAIGRNHPLNVAAWHSACTAAFENKVIRAQFREFTGHDLDAFVSWFNSEIWGADMVPRPEAEEGGS